MAMATFDTAEDGAALLAQRCDKAHKTPTGWQACCPAHEDTTPSLSITAKGDRILLFCHAGCAVDAILAALGSTIADLFVDEPPRRRRSAIPPPQQQPAPDTPPAGAATMPAPAPAPAPPAAPAPKPAGPPQVTAMYDYATAPGQLLHQVLRWEPGFRGEKKSFTQRRPHPTRPGVWIKNMKGVTKVLYNLPAVLAGVAAGALIYVPEGEKDAKNLLALGLIATTNAGGAAKWEPQYSATLRGAHLILLQDNDEAGQLHTARLTQELSGIAASVKVVAFPELPPKGDVSDWLAAGGTRAQLEARVAATPLWEPPAEVPEPAAALEDEARPVIHISTEIARVVDAAQAALLALRDGPVLFQNASRLCMVTRGGTPPAWLRRPPDLPTIREASPAHLTELAARAARWAKYDKRGQTWEPALPPRWAIDALQGRPGWPFPPLEGILHSPTLRPDGTVLDQPGYDAATGLYLASSGTVFPPLAAHPTRDQATQAVRALMEVVINFPFLKLHHGAAWCSAVLSLVCRPAILGPVPLHGITATTRASGKSLLADTIAILGTGQPAARISQVRDEDEERKRLFSLALAGTSLVCLDNVTAPLGSAPLAMALTSATITDRLLGGHRTPTAPIHAVFLATGNNLHYVGDVARRVVPIVLDPKMERPEERQGFTHNPLPPWVQQERPRLVIAALTIVKAFFEAGSPSQGLTPMGSFEAWSDLIRQAIVWSTGDDPCDGRQEIEATSNPESEDLAVLLAAWEACYGRTEITLNSVVEETTQKMQHVGPDVSRNQWNDLHDALGSCDKRFDGKRLDPTRIGVALRGWQGRVIDGKRLVSPGKGRMNRTLWSIEEV
jgi:putative DNA primase/helicase